VIYFPSTRVIQLTSVKVEKKMNRFDRADSPTEALSSSAQSPQSSMHPSTSASTVDEPVHSDPKT
jgi:mRNA-binding protein PUF3